MMMMKSDDSNNKENTYRRWASTATTISCDSSATSDNNNSIIVVDTENPNDITADLTDDEQESGLLLIKAHGSDDNGDEENVDHDGLYHFNNDNTEKKQQQQQQQSRIYNFFNRNFFPDSNLRIGNVELLDGHAVKLLKFFLVTVTLILIIHFVAQWMDSERDLDYTISQMILYDGNLIVLDIIVFYVIGRLYTKRGADTFGSIIPMIIGSSILLSGATRFPALRHTLTAYDIHCLWGWEMWFVVCGIAIPLIVVLVVKHVHYAYVKQQCLIRKLFEITITVCIWLVPYMNHPFFHLHHYYYAWLLGMHCNFNIWWSKLAMSVLWGMYIHGIAVWGRDPILTCAESLYRSQNGQCPFLIPDSNYTSLLGTLATVVASSSTDTDGVGGDWSTICSETNVDYVP